MVWSEPTIIEQPAGALAAAQVTPHESVTSVPAGAEEAAPPDPVAPPDLDLLGDQIAELSARIQAATYELLCHLRQFDRHCGWEGFRSCAHWLNWRTGLDLGAAREKLRVAAALAELNHVSAAMACGVLILFEGARDNPGRRHRQRGAAGGRGLRRHRRAGGAAGARVAAGGPRGG